MLDRALTVLSVGAALALLWAVTVQLSGRGDAVRLEQPVVGSTVPIVGMDWAKNRQTLIIAIQPDCRYCEDSMPFYRQLLASNKTGAFYPLIVSPRAEAVTRTLLTSHDVNTGDVRISDFGRLGVTRTPTVMLVGSDGRVERVWIGQLTPAHENELFRLLGIRRMGPRASTAGTRGAVGITAAELATTYEDTPIVDVRPREAFAREHVAGSVNVPIDELEARLQHEVPSTLEAVVVCDYVPECRVVVSTPGAQDRCQRSLSVAKSLGFMKVRILEDDLPEVEAAGIPIARQKS